MCTICGTKSVVQKIFQLTCFILAGYITYSQFLLYFENKDTSSVSYRKLNSESKDVYPTYSFCFKSSKGTIFKNENFLGVGNNSSRDSRQLYKDMLFGIVNMTQKGILIDYEDEIILVKKFISYKSTLGFEG